MTISKRVTNAPAAVAVAIAASTVVIALVVVKAVAIRAQRLRRWVAERLGLSSPSVLLFGAGRGGSTPLATTLVFARIICVTERASRRSFTGADTVAFSIAAAEASSGAGARERIRGASSCILNDCAGDGIAHHLAWTAGILAPLTGVRVVRIFALCTRTLVYVVSPRSKEVAAATDIALFASGCGIAARFAGDRVDNDLLVLPIRCRVLISVGPSVGSALHAVILDETVSDGPRRRVPRVLVVADVLDPKVVNVARDVSTDGTNDVDDKVETHTKPDENS